MKQDDPGFSRLVPVDELPSRGLDITVEAGPEERAAIAERFGLAGIDSLIGAYHLVPMSKGARLKGEMRARLRQTCVVSLDVFEAELREPVDLAFIRPGEERGAARTGEASGRHAEITLSMEDEDPPEPLIGGRIDLGSVTLEFLALGLDSYPRKPGIVFSDANAGKEPRPSPFSALADLHRKSSVKG
jgi:hypothetical protein